MCDLTVLAVTGLAMSAAGTVTSVVGGIKGARAEERAGRARKQTMLENAEIAERAADDARERGQFEARITRLQGRQVAGTHLAQTGASGVDVGSGSAADVSAGTIGMSEFDAQTLILNAAQEAWGYEQQADQFRKGGVYALQEAKGRASAMRWGAAASALSGAANIFTVASSYGRKPATATEDAKPSALASKLAPRSTNQRGRPLAPTGPYHDY